MPAPLVVWGLVGIVKAAAVVYAAGVSTGAAATHWLTKKLGAKP